MKTLRWKLRLTERFSGKTRTVTVAADSRAAALAAYEANWSRFNDLNGVEMAMTKPEEIERAQARIIAGAIHEIVHNSNEPKDRPHSYPEAAINAVLASLTKTIEGCMSRADAAAARD